MAEAKSLRDTDEKIEHWNKRVLLHSERARKRPLCMVDIDHDMYSFNHDLVGRNCSRTSSPKRLRFANRWSPRLHEVVASVAF